MPNSPTIWSFAVGAVIFFAASLLLLYKGRSGHEASLRRGVDFATWGVMLMAGIYFGFAITQHFHAYAAAEMIFNGVLIAILVIMRWLEISQRLAFAILLIGVHGLWDALHLFDLPLANDLVPRWYASACAILDFSYFVFALPIFITIIKFGRVDAGKSAS
jgi:hypothetical protein